jgi:hypothetical protein
MIGQPTITSPLNEDLKTGMDQNLHEIVRCWSLRKFGTVEVSIGRSRLTSSPSGSVLQE